METQQCPQLVNLMMAPNCEFCGSNSWSQAAVRPDFFLGGSQMYTMYECGHCGVNCQFNSPAQTEFGAIYPPEYPQYTPPVNTDSHARQVDRRYGLRKRCLLITSRVQHGRALDVGCATGDFLGEMKLVPDWEVVGVEPSHVAAQIARRSNGVNVVEAVMNNGPFPPGAFDAITMWDVLEHVYDPRVVLAECARILSNGGILVINHPNLESIDRRLFGRFWIGYELPRHLYLFPHGLLRKLMSDQGFKELERRCVYGSHAAGSTSLVFALESLVGRGRFSAFVKSLLLSRPSRVLCAPYFKVIDLLGRGSNVTVVFQKSI